MAAKQIVNAQTSRFISLLGQQTQWKSCFSAAVGRLYSTEKTAEQKAEGASTEDSAEQLKKLTADLETVNKEVTTLKEKNDELMDKYRRSLADSENLRVRLNKQIADAKIFGIQSFCKDLLEVADILGHATKAVPQDQLESNPHLKNLYEGLTMTNASLLQVFKRHGLEPMNPLNEKFNPNMHEALFQKIDASVEPDTVVEVTKLGYKLHERVIRPALVGVSKAS
ncbi:grpE protein homolog, mitochondrial [Musca domestica]|uniref:GrpE protein homolog n=1 Tax=Musca domestica TaxID=7370 RepID=T1P7L2_MUSDO|nr:grpE protein homolog, mitochondrial [Musca domestica]